MQCPRDGSALTEIRQYGQTLDRCASCQGLWLDRGELGAILGLGQDLSLERLAVDDVPHLTCPSCRAGLEAHWFSAGRQVMVDTCPSCRGVWLDGGELQALLREIYGIR